MRVCAIDVGTNTVQSLVADVEPDGRLTVVADEERFARLGQGVDASHRLAPEAMDRALACLRASVETARRLGAERVVVGATSASRDASNVGDLIARVRDELGIEYTVLSGVDEATLSFRGAIARWPGPSDHNVVVVDIGGGSTEIALGTRAAGVASRISLDVGSVRITERHLLPPPATATQAAAARADVRRAFASAPPALAAAVSVGASVAVTGSAGRVMAHLAGPAAGGTPDVPVVPAAAVAAWSARLLALTPTRILALDPAVLAGRADVVAASALVLDTVLASLGAPAYVSTGGGLRLGLALREGMPGEPGPERVGGMKGVEGNA